MCTTDVTCILNVTDKDPLQLEIFIQTILTLGYVE